MLDGDELPYARDLPELHRALAGSSALRPSASRFLVAGEQGASVAAVVVELRQLAAATPFGGSPSASLFELGELGGIRLLLVEDRRDVGDGPRRRHERGRHRNRAL